MTSPVSRIDFTVASYNCGGLPGSYDYLRSACMQKIMRKRSEQEPQIMAINNRIQELALRRMFSSSLEQAIVDQEWSVNGYSNWQQWLVQDPKDLESERALLDFYEGQLIGENEGKFGDGEEADAAQEGYPIGFNTSWYKMLQDTITPYHVSPISLYDDEVRRSLVDQARSILGEGAEEDLPRVRKQMLRDIFEKHLKHDIICLQEANEIDPDMFPEGYNVRIARNPWSKNAIVWKKDRFKCQKIIGNRLQRAFAVCLQDKKTGREIAVASAHLQGCDPFIPRINEGRENYDCTPGDSQLGLLLTTLEQEFPDQIKLIGMDANVTALHPRLYLLKDLGYQVDYSKCIGPTCTNPYQILDTKIDWIALKQGKETDTAVVENLSVEGIHLNEIENNPSDHLPIAAKISYLAPLLPAWGTYW